MKPTENKECKAPLRLIAACWNENWQEYYSKTYLLLNDMPSLLQRFKDVLLTDKPEETLIGHTAFMNKFFGNRGKKKNPDAWDVLDRAFSRAHFMYINELEAKQRDSRKTLPTQPIKQADMSIGLSPKSNWK